MGLRWLTLADVHTFDTLMVWIQYTSCAVAKERLRSGSNHDIGGFWGEEQKARIELAPQVREWFVRHPQSAARAVLWAHDMLRGYENHHQGDSLSRWILELATLRRGT